MLRQLLRQLGTACATLLITAVSVLSSVAISVSILLLFHRESSLIYSIFVSVTVPLLLAPPLAYAILDLLARLDKAEIELKAALSEIKTLTGLIPICASCKKIRDDHGYWHQVEVYIRDRSDAEFSHGLCPDCAKMLYPDYFPDE